MIPEDDEEDWDEIPEPDCEPPMGNFNVISHLGQEVAWRCVLSEGDVAYYTVTGGDIGTKHCVVWWAWSMECEEWVIPQMGDRYRIHGDYRKAYESYRELVKAHSCGPE